MVEPLKALQFCSNVLFRWRQISAWRHSGKPFSTWGEGTREQGVKGGRKEGRRQGGRNEKVGDKKKDRWKEAQRENEGRRKDVREGWVEQIDERRKD